MPSTSLSMLLYLDSTLDRLSLVNVIRHGAILSSASSHGQFMPSFAYNSPVVKPTPDTSISKYSRSPSLENFRHVYLLIKALALLYSSVYVLFNVQSSFTNVSLLNGSHILAVAGDYLFR